MRIKGLNFSGLERWLLAAGVTFWLVFAAALVHRSFASRMALVAFERAKMSAGSGSANETAELPGDGYVDFSLWSEKRVRAYQQSLAVHRGAPMAVLNIERLGIQVPVLEGTDEFSLNRGVGWIEGTSRPGEDGNVGIAGHRDGFFRRLKDILPGDRIELSTITGTRTYVVDGFEVVNPDDVAVLRPRGTPAVTLVTCYPFYFFGDAPQRFVLHAALKQ